MTESPSLTKSEVANLLGVSERTVTRKVKRGELKCYKRGSKVYFPSNQFKEQSNTEVSSFQGILEALVSQLKEKDSQIEKLQDDMKNQMRVLENQQILTKQLQDKYLLLPETTQSPEIVKPRRKPRKTTGKTAKTRGKTREREKTPRKTQKKKKGFWERLFE